MKWYLAEAREVLETVRELQAQSPYDAKIEAIQEYEPRTTLAIVCADPRNGWYETCTGIKQPDPGIYEYICLNRGAWSRGGSLWAKGAIWFDDSPDELFDESGRTFDWQAAIERGEVV